MRVVGPDFGGRGLFSHAYPLYSFYRCKSVSVLMHVVSLFIIYLCMYNNAWIISDGETGKTNQPCCNDFIYRLDTK